MQYISSVLFGLAKGVANNIPNKYREWLEQFEHMLTVSVSIDDFTTITSVSLFLRQKGIKFDKYLTSGKGHQISIGECSFVYIHEGLPFFFTFVKAKTSDHYHNFEIKTIKGNEQAVFDFLEYVRDLESRSQLRGLCVKQLNAHRYNAEWLYVSKLHTRQLDSLCLNKEHKDAIKRAIDKYLTNYGKCDKFGMPNKLIIMLSGPVGSGKSNLIKAIATELNRSIYYAGPDMLCTTNFVEAVRMAKNNLMVTEEIELVFGKELLEFEDDDNLSELQNRYKRRRKASNQVMGFSNTINIMDGILTPTDLIWVFTTNELESLDRRLVRNSRVDLNLVIDYANSQALLEFACHVYQQPLLLPFGMENMQFLGSHAYETYNEFPNDPIAFFAKMASLNNANP